MSKKCVLYSRVSKDDGSQTPENQVEPLRMMAESLGLEIVGEYQDYVSGGTCNRPQFQQMLSDAKSRTFDFVLVWSLDRFSREGVSKTLAYLEQLKRFNIALKSLQESWVDTSDEGIGQVIILLFAWVAKQERIRISDRTKAGLARARKKGTLKVRGKDKGRRITSGYNLYWQKVKGKVAVQ